jgi:hypothetical protein
VAGKKKGSTTIQQPSAVFVGQPYTIPYINSSGGYIPPRYRNTNNISNLVSTTSGTITTGGGYSPVTYPSIGSGGVTSFDAPDDISDVKAELIETTLNPYDAIDKLVRIVLLLRTMVLDLSERVESYEMLQDDDETT